MIVLMDEAPTDGTWTSGLQGTLGCVGDGVLRDVLSICGQNGYELTSWIRTLDDYY
jgi:hypothetical protein